MTQAQTTTAKPAGLIGRIWSNAWVPVASVLVALLLAGVILLLTGSNPIQAYWALIEGAFLKPNALSNTLVITTPYILLGLGVSLAFLGGLFNIGGEGQFYIGAVTATYIGYSMEGLPPIVHLPLAVLGGGVAGGLWAGIAGVLKAKRGAHEVITTIMLNYIAFALTDFLINGPMRSTGTAPRTPFIQESARLPTLFGGDDRLHLGFILAIAAAIGYYFLTKRMPLGFRIRTVGVNPDAARYAGINVSRIVIVTMFISGALCGVAGATETLGVYHYMPAAFTAGYGFDAIAIAFLGQGTAIGVVLASLLFGALNSGSTFMQFSAGVSINIIAVLQAFIILFVGAPGIIRGIFERKKRA